MSMDFQTLGRGKDEEKVCTDILIYGRSGAGKTYRAATAPSPFIISPDPTGHRSVPYPIPGRVIHKLSDVEEVLEWFESGQHVEHGIRTCIIDGLSFFYDLFTTEVGRYWVETQGAKDMDMIPIAARNKIMQSYRRLVRRMVSLTQNENPVNVVFTTLDERLEEGDKAQFQIRPKFGSAGMNENFPGFFSVITYIEPVGEEDEDGIPLKTRKMLFTEYKGIMARDRLGVFPDYAPEAVNLSEYLK